MSKTHLQKDYFSDMLGIGLEKFLNGEHAINQSLCIIQSIHAKHILDIIAQRFWRLFRHVLESLEWNSNWQRPNSHSPTSMLGQEAFSIDTTSKPSLHAVNEVEAVILNVKPDQIAAQNALKNHVDPWEDLDNVPRGERNVQEETNFAAQVLLVSHLSERATNICHQKSLL